MINLGIIGAGSIAKTMAQTVRKMNENGIGKIRMYAVASRNLEKAKAFAAENKAEKSFGSYESLLCDTEVDLVYIATPHSFHHEQAKLSLEHNKHVLCEKAFTVNACQAEDLISLAESKNLLITEAIWTRYQPMRKIISDEINSGVLGKPLSLSAELSYSIMNKERLVRPELAGGALLDVGIYPLNFATMVFGHPDEVHSVCQKSESGVDVHDSITLFYNDGKMASLTSGMCEVGNRNAFVNCENGFFQIKNVNNPESIELFDKNYNLIKKITRPEQFTGYEYELLESAEAIENGKTECPSMPHSETIYMMKLLDEIRNQFGVKYPFE